MIQDLGQVRILYVEDNDIDLLLTENYLEGSAFLKCELVHARSLAAAIDRLDGSGDIDVVLLDLNLPDSSGIATYKALAKAFPALPVVVLTALDDLTLVQDLACCGAQDCLQKGKINRERLDQSVLFALNRQSVLNSKASLTTKDELTGLLNRGGFMEHAENQLELANRESRRAFLLLMDVDNLKLINDRFGHDHGDNVLISMADISRKIFRDVDILGRIGGDEFAVFAIEELSAHYGRVLERFNNAIEAYNMENPLPMIVSVSCGLSYSHPEKRTGLNRMLTTAENIMVEQKAIRGK